MSIVHKFGRPIIFWGTTSPTSAEGEEDDDRNWIGIVFLRLRHLKSHYDNEFNQAPRLLISTAQFKVMMIVPVEISSRPQVIHHRQIIVMILFFSS